MPDSMTPPAAMSQPDISSLMDTLGAQQHLLQKLYNELDAEREASATAASEALSVIIRLQGEKAAVKMEAEQYKRLAEEKMCHAEESIAIIEDIIYQKEMEVATLDYQVQSYRYKLVRMGADDPGGGELTYPENLLQRGESLAGGGETNLGRRNSAPFLLKYKKAMTERESSHAPESDHAYKNSEDHLGHDQINDFLRADISSHGGNINSYAEEIRKLDIRVKEIAGPNYVAQRSPPSLSSRPSASSLSFLTNSQPETRPPSPRPTKENYGKKGEASSNYPCSTGVHDVFEVPQADERNADEVFESKDVIVHPEGVRLSGKDEPDWLKKIFQSTGNEINLCKPSHIAAIDRGVGQLTASGNESRPALHLVTEISEIDEGETVGESSSREEELKLLKEIKKKLDLLHDEITNHEVNKKPSTRDQKPSVCPLPEAMLHFWL